MARTKGSLGKKTIEKLKAEGKWDYNNNCPLMAVNLTSKPDIKTNTKSDTKHDVESKIVSFPSISFKHENTFTSKTGSGSLTDLVDKNVNDTVIKDIVSTIDTEENIPEDVSFENPSTKDILMEDSVKENSNNNDKNISSKKSNKNSNKNNSNKYNHCDRCGIVIYCEPRRVDSNLLIGLADYHRNTPRYVNLCDKCCHELNDIFEEWLTNENKGGNKELKRYG